MYSPAMYDTELSHDRNISKAWACGEAHSRIAMQLCIQLYRLPAWYAYIANRMWKADTSSMTDTSPAAAAAAADTMHRYIHH